ncbi:HlyB/MsbA family ABC transporter [Pedobacter quisquiliarum]|uniref:HlyB/MsbA family ABC transporter n=1 Tax=Pedobacter quisquiliarum TaxID=1834438 RepID=A0A916UCA1_9SPHI|nr:ABC transporter ATP-binding protein [Pedobacter quisquiliarum]GGC67730.1 HlyB/MsbA family ABC transporter [Pedobacter quisquiliarum]
MIAILARKIQNLQTNLKLKRTIKLVWSAAKGWMLFSVSMIIVETVLFLGSLYALKLLVDEISKINVHDPEAEYQIVKHVVIAGIFSILYSIARFVSAYAIEVQATKVSNFIDDRIHETAIQMDLSYYESPAYFDILKRAKDAGADRPNLVITTLLEITKNVLNLCAIGSLFIAINWLLLPLLIVFALPTLFVRIYFSNKQNEWRIKHTPLERKSGYLSNLLTSDISAKEIRSYNLGTYFKKLYLTFRMEILQQKLDLSYKRTSKEIITTGIGSIGFFTCIAYIALGTVSGTNSVGDIVMFLMIFPQSFNLIQYISSGISILYTNNIFINSIFELFDLKPSSSDQGFSREIPVRTEMDLIVKDLNFTYPGSDRPTLKNISLRIPLGKIIAIVGLNGAGKSTLIKLLCGLYKVDSGEISLGNININQFDVSTYRRQVSAVFQDFSRYNFSAEENIWFGNIDKEAVYQEIVKASENAGASSFIEKLPNGYKSMMGKLFEDGHEVSIGQWQKLAIARALYSEARFLILDEATSALDALAEKELFESFRKHIGNRAAVIISHRHSAVKHADYIYVLSGGQILQEGTDSDLLNMEGDYSKLFKENIEV